MPECALPFEPNNFHATLFYLANIMILKVLISVQSVFKCFKLMLHRENSIKVSGWLWGRTLKHRDKYWKNGENTGKVREICQSGNVGTMKEKRS